MCIKSHILPFFGICILHWPFFGKKASKEIMKNSERCGFRNFFDYDIIVGNEKFIQAIQADKIRGRGGARPSNHAACERN